MNIFLHPCADVPRLLGIRKSLKAIRIGRRTLSAHTDLEEPKRGAANGPEGVAR
jgi:hypothetical protein